MRERAQRALGRAQHRHALARETPRETRAAPGNHRPASAMTAGLSCCESVGASALNLVDRVFQRAGDHRQAEAADVRIVEQGLRGLVPEAHVAQHMRGDVDRILERGVTGQDALERIDGGWRKAGHVEADRIGEIEREAFDRARIGDDARPFHRRLHARQQLGDIDQLFHRLDHVHGGVAQQRRGGRIVARERAGVRAGRGLRALAAAGEQQRRSAFPPRGRAAPLQEQLRLADLLDEQRDDLGFVVVDQRARENPRRRGRLRFRSRCRT